MFRYWKLIFANLVALVCGIYLAVYGFNLPGSVPWNNPPIEGFFWPDQKQLTDFSMVDHQGGEFNLASLNQAWSLVFFGYTYCPDICPVTMSTLREASQQIKQSADPDYQDLKIRFISVDGERDRTDHLANYIQFYDEEFMAASGSPTQVDSLTSQLGVPYEIEAHEPGADNYLVSHSGAVFLISPQAKLAAIFQAPYDATTISDRYQAIRQFLRKNS